MQLGSELENASIPPARAVRDKARTRLLPSDHNRSRNPANSSGISGRDRLVHSSCSKSASAALSAPCATHPPSAADAKQFAFWPVFSRVPGKRIAHIRSRSYTQPRKLKNAGSTPATARPPPHADALCADLGRRGTYSQRAIWRFLACGRNFSRSAATPPTSSSRSPTKREVARGSPISIRCARPSAR